MRHRILIVAALVLTMTLLAGCASIKAVAFPEKEKAAYVGDVIALSPDITYSVDNPSQKDIDKLASDAAWSSSDTNIVTVDGRGVCVAKSAGTASITYTNGKFTDTCDITVKEPITDIAPADVYVSNISDPVKASVTIRPQAAENDHVTYAISDASVATVDDSGTVTFIKAGTATLTVTSDNGVVGKSVVHATEYPTGLAASETEVTVTEGKRVEDITYTPDFTGTSLTSWGKELDCWSDDASVATITNGDITGVAPGSTVVHVSTDPWHKVVADIPVTVKKWVADATTKEGRLELATKKAQEIVSQIITPGMSDYDKAKAIYDWMEANVATQYDQSNASYQKNFGNEAYSAFYMGISACSGQCRAVVLMCNACGLEVRHYNEGQWAHQWCKVNIDGTWTVLDPQGGIFGGTTHPFENPPAYYDANGWPWYLVSGDQYVSPGKQ